MGGATFCTIENYWMCDYHKKDFKLTILNLNGSGVYFVLLIIKWLMCVQNIWKWIFGIELEVFETPMFSIDDIMVSYRMISICMFLGLVKTLLLYMIMQVKIWMIVLALEFLTYW